MGNMDLRVKLANMNFGEKLAAVRKERGYSQAEAAKAIQVEKSRISNWENNKGKPTLDNIMALSKFLGVSIDYLVFENVPQEGVEAINDFELYEYFRKTENLPPEKKQAIRDHVDALVFKEKIKQIPESDFPKVSQEAKTSPVRRVIKR